MVVPPQPRAGVFWGRLCESVHKASSRDLALESVSRMETEFTPIFLFMIVAIMPRRSACSWSAPCLGPSKRTPVKQMPYESGMDPIGDARQRFDVRYYLVAIVFLLFDVELLVPLSLGRGPVERQTVTIAELGAPRPST